MGREKDMTGFKTDTLLVLEYAGTDKYGSAMWKCLCSCGKTFITCGSRIRSGKTRSCGHLQRETASKLNRTHGCSHHHLFKQWNGIKQRCTNKNNAEFSYYGGKGISICKEWQDFETYMKWAIDHGWKKGLTIDRIDNSKGYSPENCRFATRADQNRNTTRTHRILDGDGNLITAAEAARAAGLNRSTVAKWCRNNEANTLYDVIQKEKTINNGMHPRNN